MHEFGWVGVGHPGRGVLGARGIAHLIRIWGSAKPPGWFALRSRRCARRLPPPKQNKQKRLGSRPLAETPGNQTHKSTMGEWGHGFVGRGINSPSRICTSCSLSIPNDLDDNLHQKTTRKQIRN